MLQMGTFFRVIGFCSYVLLSSFVFSMQKDAKIYVAGHNGLVGRAIVRALLSEGYCHIIVRNSSELDLRNQQDVNDFFAQEQRQYCLLT